MDPFTLLNLTLASAGAAALTALGARSLYRTLSRARMPEQVEWVFPLRGRWLTLLLAVTFMVPAVPLLFITTFIALGFLIHVLFVGAGLLIGAALSIFS